MNNYFVKVYISIKEIKNIRDRPDTLLMLLRME
jgi:hypothetical protein